MSQFCKFLIVMTVIVLIQIGCIFVGVHKAYKEGCINGVTKTLQGFRDVGVQFTTPTDPNTWCEKEWKER